MATARDSAFYTSKKAGYLQDNRKSLSPLLAIPMEFTIVSAAATGDTYNLCVLPANCRVVAAFITVTVKLSASAGVNLTLAVGDSGSAGRYIAAFDADAVGATSVLAGPGQGYTPTADTIVLATLTGAPFVTGAAVGALIVIPGY